MDTREQLTLSGRSGKIMLLGIPDSFPPKAPRYLHITVNFHEKIVHF